MPRRVIGIHSSTNLRMATTRWNGQQRFPIRNSNRKVGMFGGSYVGATQYLAAVAKPPHLAGICPNYTACNYHDGWTYQGGAFEQWFNESWTTGLALNGGSPKRRKYGGGRKWRRSEDGLASAYINYPIVESTAWRPRMSAESPKATWLAATSPPAAGCPRLFGLPRSQHRCSYIIQREGRAA